MTLRERDEWRGCLGLDLLGKVFGELFWDEIYGYCREFVGKVYHLCKFRNAGIHKFLAPTLPICTMKQ